MMRYDYIFAGCGCAAFSILVRMLKHPLLTNKKILIIEKDEKNKNDRTWSWWEVSPNPFSHLAIQQWQEFELGFNQKYISTNISPYTYKTVMADDVYEYSKEQLKSFPNLIWVKETILEVQSEGIVVTDKQSYKGDYIFNSLIQHPQSNKEVLLWQHFLGHFIETEQESFNPKQAIWMDFNVPQQNGATFMYVLPFTTKKALVEYTIFSEAILSPVVYTEQIEAYLKQQNIGNYKVYHMEFEKIPMTTYQFPKKNNRVLFIGSAGGATRASTGFTFNGIQQQADQILSLMIANKLNNYDYRTAEKIHKQLDAVLLKLLDKKILTGEEIFGNLFYKNPAAKILKFLSGETTILETLQVMNSVQRLKFIKAIFLS
jgi:lycopene beta-cyclase